MRKTHVVLGLALAGALAVACSSSSSGPTTFTVAGTCGPLAAVLGAGGTIALNGPCNLGAAGDYTIDAGLSVNLALCTGVTGPVTSPVSISAQFIQSSTAVLNSSFVGAADITCPLAPQTIGVGGTFTFAGGTGPYVDATGTAIADGGVVVSETEGFSATLGLNGSLTY
jgi:hypothetical protein